MVRRLLRLAVLIALLVVAGVLIPRVPAAACSCMEMTEAESFGLAQVVFTGELVEVRTLPPAEFIDSGDPERFIFAVERVYKGAAFAEQSVVTPMDGAACGLEISGPGTFIVFAHHELQNQLVESIDGELYADLCGGTRALDAAGVPAAFGDGVPPEEGSSPIGGPTAAPSTTSGTSSSGTVAASDAVSRGNGVALSAVVAALASAAALALLAILAMKRRS